MPTIGLILPFHNPGRLLWPAIRSVTAQSFSDWELLAVDDGSTDGGGAVADEWCRRDSRIRLLSPGRVGLIQALNLGIRESSGDLLARMDADDLMHRDRLARQAAFLNANPKTDLVSCLVESFPRRGILEGMTRYQEWLNSLVTHEQLCRDLFVESPFAHPSIMVRRESMEAVGGYQDHGWAEDYDLWLRMYLSGCRFGKVPEVLHFWRDSPARLTRADDRYSLHNFRLAKLHYLRQSHLAGHDTVQVWGAGRGGKVFARVIEEAGLAISRFLDIDPNKIGNTLRGAPVVPPEHLCDDPRDEPILVVVGVKGARDLIREWLDSHGFTEPRDYVCVA